MPIATRAAVSSSAPPELDLLLHWPERRSGRQWIAIACVSAGYQLFFFWSLLRLASIPVAAPQTRAVQFHVTHLYLPPDLLTQKPPNRTKPAADITMADLQPSKPAPASPRRFQPPTPAPAKPAPVAPQIEPPPQIGSQQPAPQIAAGDIAAPPAPSKANSPFQDVGSDTRTPTNQHPSLHVPKGTVDGVIDELSHNTDARHMIVRDEAPPARLMPGATASPASQHVEVELKSDSDAPDFRDYLKRILGIVRANWRRVTPESVRMGTLRGQNTVELVIDRDGSIPKLVIGQPSNIDALDRASVAGVSMSNPLPPLPADFKGQQVRLAFTFKYNVQE